jgi:hypothetical protein
VEEEASRRAVAQPREVPTLLKPGLDGKVVASRRSGSPVPEPAVSSGVRGREDAPRRPGRGGAWGAGDAVRAIAPRE